LLFLDGSVVEISPAPFNKGKRRFIEDLKAFYEAGNFHPDFIIWQLEGKRRRIARFFRTRR